MRRLLIPALVLITLPASGTARQDDARDNVWQEVGCKSQRPTRNRASPYDSTAFTISGQRAVICYGRPAARGRTMIGGTAVPFGKLWRTGANEPTIVHIQVAATIAGVAVTPGSYSIYTVPGQKEWEVIVNRSISQWGHENSYTDVVKAQEVGRGQVASSALNDHVEVFTIRSAPAGKGADLILEWERTRVAIPVRAAAK